MKLIYKEGKPSVELSGSDVKRLAKVADDLVPASKLEIPGATVALGGLQEFAKACGCLQALDKAMKASLELEGD